MRKRKPPKKIIFCLRKYVPAKSLKDALRIEKDIPVYDGFIDSDKSKELADCIGFDDGNYVDEDDEWEDPIPEVKKGGKKK